MYVFLALAACVLVVISLIRCLQNIFSNIENNPTNYFKRNYNQLTLDDFLIKLYY